MPIPGEPLPTITRTPILIFAYHALLACYANYCYAQAMNGPVGAVIAKGSPVMLFLISHRYPVLGAVLSAISNIVFLALGLAEHSAFLIVMSAPFLALSIVQFARRRHTPQARP